MSPMSFFPESPRGSLGRSTPRLPVLVTALVLSAGVAARCQDEDDDPEAALVAAIEAALEHHRPSRSPLADFDPALASRTDRRTALRLRTRRVGIDLRSAGHDEALRALRRSSGLTVAVSQRARRALAESEPKVTLLLRDVSAESAFSLLSGALGEFRFTLRYGALWLVTSAEHRPRRSLVVHDVRDLVRRRRNFRAPRLGLGGLRDD